MPRASVNCRSGPFRVSRSVAPASLRIPAIRCRREGSLSAIPVPLRSGSNRTMSSVDAGIVAFINDQVRTSAGSANRMQDEKRPEPSSRLITTIHAGIPSTSPSRWSATICGPVRAGGVRPGASHVATVTAIFLFINSRQSSSISAGRSPVTGGNAGAIMRTLACRPASANAPAATDPSFTGISAALSAAAPSSHQPRAAPERNPQLPFSVRHRSGALHRSAPFPRAW